MRPCSILLSLAFGIVLAGAARAGEESIQLKEGAGRDLTATRCVLCHSLDYIQMNAIAMDRVGWEKSVRKMIDRFGAPISEQEAKAIVDYLSTQYSS